MGRKFITPLQDASIYEQFQPRNTGFDEIIEVGKSTAIDGAIRGLIQFDIDGLLSGSVPVSSSFFLNLRIAHADNFKRNQSVEIHTVVFPDIEATGSVFVITDVSADGERVTIDGKEYTFDEGTPPGTADGRVWTGGEFGEGTSSVAVMAASFIAAINLETSSFGGASGPGGAAGEAYGLNTTLHPTVTASAGSGSTVILTAKSPGAAGNLLDLSTNDDTIFLVSGDFLIDGEDGVSQSWDEGTGFFEQDLENSRDGATWKIRNDDDDIWLFTSGVLAPGGSTGSLVDTHIFDWEPDDIRLDISGQVRAWITGSPNNGLLIKIPTADEENDRVLSNIRFFSRNTHTIYPPTIEAVWSTQTMSVLPNCGLAAAPEEIELFVVNPRPEFVTGSTQRIRFGARTLQPIKDFTDTFRFGNKFFFPSASHIGIVDAATEAFIVPFDAGSLLSADGTGSFFDLKVENMYIGRAYKILVRIEKPWGPEVINTGHTFRVVNT